MKNIYHDCLAMQDASNLSGVANALARNMLLVDGDIQWLAENGVVLAREKHPVMMWSICKLADLVGFSLGETANRRLSLALPVLNDVSRLHMRSDEHLFRMKGYVNHLERLENDIAWEIQNWMDSSQPPTKDPAESLSTIEMEQLVLAPKPTGRILRVEATDSFGVTDAATAVVKGVWYGKPDEQAEGWPPYEVTKDPAERARLKELHDEQFIAKHAPDLHRDLGQMDPETPAILRDPEVLLAIRKQITKAVKERLTPEQIRQEIQEVLEPRQEE